ncbi:MAG: Fe-S protein assembly chaperone HscA [Rickettsiales bacterium]|nr:Fe-S protein assembly chaperone HscA [Rickettsiales bacterium]
MNRELTLSPPIAMFLQIHEPGQTPDPHDDGVAVGIDLGTTHSVIAIMQEGQPVAIEDAAGHSIIPSVVAYQSGRAVVGGAARDRLLAGDAYAVSSVKRLMGRASLEVAASAPALLPLLQSHGESVPLLMMDDKARTPMEISADILRHLKTMAEEALGRPVREAVITVPAYFDDAARLATKDAARLAGLEVLRLINEPTAAALAYGLDEAKEGVYAIFDFGGGTFDVSLLNLEKGVFQVLSTAGDTALGGDDIDDALAVALFGKTLTAAHRAEARRIKEALSNAHEVAVSPSFNAVSRMMVTRSELAVLAQPLVERALAICAQAMEDAHKTSAELNGMVLVGGSTRMPVVREAVAAFFEQSPLSDLDPDRVVAYGAAVQAHQLTRGGDHLLLDVIPLSLGIETMGDLAEKLILRNTPIPAVVAQEFTTYQDGQTGMMIHIVQGERELASHCRSLARFELTGIPPMSAGSARIRVMFQVDADGLLTVSAEETTSGQRQEVTVKPSYGLPIEEVERMILESFENARADITLRLLVEARVDAARLALDLRQAMQADAALLEDEEKKMLQRELSALDAACLGDDRDLIDAGVMRLKHLSGPFAQKRMDSAIGLALKGTSITNVY